MNDWVKRQRISILLASFHVLFSVSLWLSHIHYLYINLACLSVCLSVCLFVFNKRQNGWTDRAKKFCGNSRDPREGLRMIKFSKICLHLIVRFLKILKIHGIFFKIPWNFCFRYLLTRRIPVYFISNKKIYKWNKRWARSALNF